MHKTARAPPNAAFIRFFDAGHADKFFQAYPQPQGNGLSDVNSHYQLRPIREADIPQVLGLMREMAEFEKLTDIFQATEASLHRSFFGAQPAANGLVAHTLDNPDVPVAYIMWFHNYSSFLDKRGLYLEDIYVQPAHRGRGLGGLVLKHLARLALELDCGRFEWTVLDWNQNAIDFYIRHGARILHDWRIARVTGDALRALADMPD
jgi:GNAT superfamily N-acetyltransferase